MTKLYNPTTAIYKLVSEEGQEILGMMVQRERDHTALMCRTIKRSKIERKLSHQLQRELILQYRMIGFKPYNG